jgi:hypothetical protein
MRVTEAFGRTLQLFLCRWHANRPTQGDDPRLDRPDLRGRRFNLCCSHRARRSGPHRGLYTFRPRSRPAGRNPRLYRLRQLRARADQSKAWCSATFGKPPSPSPPATMTGPRATPNTSKYGSSSCWPRQDASRWTTARTRPPASAGRHPRMLGRRRFLTLCGHPRGFALTSWTYFGCSGPPLENNIGRFEPFA